MTSDIVKFSALADRIGIQYVRLIKDGVNDPQEIFNRMMSFMPEFHELWTRTTDYELAALSNKYPNFMNFCKIVEQLTAVENRKDIRDYDGEAKFNEQQRNVLADVLGEVSRIHEKLLELKQHPDAISESKLAELKLELDSWMIRATDTRDQLKQSGSSEYAVLTVSTVFRENYQQAKSIFKDLEDFDPEFIFSYLEDNDAIEFHELFGTNDESLLVAGHKTINRLERYFSAEEFSRYKVILSALVRDFNFPANRYTSGIALGLYISIVENSSSVSDLIKQIAGTEFVLLLRHLSTSERLQYDRDSEVAYSRWNEYLKNPSGFVI